VTGQSGTVMQWMTGTPSGTDNQALMKFSTGTYAQLRTTQATAGNNKNFLCEFGIFINIFILIFFTVLTHSHASIDYRPVIFRC
jgi:hypothetical protein